MVQSLSPESIIKFMKLSVCLVASWPPNKKSSRQELINHEILWWILIIILISTVIPMIYSTYYSRKNILICVSLTCHSFTCSQCIIKMIICKCQFKRMQFLFDDMEEYVKNSSLNERFVFEDIMNKYIFVHISFISSSLVSSTGVLIGPLILPQSLPAEVTYPFSLDNYFIFATIYLQQCIAAYQCSSYLSMDCQMASLIWYIIARFEILSNEIQSIKHESEFFRWIQKHQQVLL